MIKARHTLATFLVVCGSVSTTWAANSPAPTQNLTKEKMLAIAEHQDMSNPRFVAARCRGLFDATTIHRMIMRSNPVSRKQKHLGAPFDWVTDRDIFDNLIALEEEADGPDHSYINDYMKAFGPISIPSRVPELKLYIADKATCLERFGKK
ncbi:hypothetical protein L0Z65_08680 [Phaeobacter sp. BS52]|uniref:hypothetical protein n=1 Tax=Phaeobacter sp. BS52 TaxID=2907241 RepID=UPI00386DF9B5